ncbi:hypothetical protein J6590_097954 [Homalodisca vitripennis]|nr:hypothetical protein J6590_009806 [Homalodisca vitripennis]KAG8334075.1 hypothetical protein J6590_097954 [Homalodisca vitripennis]
MGKKGKKTRWRRLPIGEGRYSDKYLTKLRGLTGESVAKPLYPDPAAPPGAEYRTGQNTRGTSLLDCLVISIITN